jgi:hypothetical protein
MHPSCGAPSRAGSSRASRSASSGCGSWPSPRPAGTSTAGRSPRSSPRCSTSWRSCCIDLDYAVALGVWVGLISSLIPAIGTYLAGALPLVVALAASPAQALWVLIAIVVYQQIENYVIVPKITASTMELHPAVAFLAVLGGAALAGATGALLAIPAVAIVAALISASSEEYEVLEHSLLETGSAAAKDLVEDAHGGAARPPA